MSGAADATQSDTNYDRNNRKIVAEVFQSHYDQLLTGISNPDRLTSALYTQSLISSDTRDRIFTTSGISKADKAAKLLNAVGALFSTQDNPSLALGEFCRIISSEPALKHVAKSMKANVGDHDVASDEEIKLIPEAQHLKDNIQPSSDQSQDSAQLNKQMRKVFRRQYSDLTETIQHPESLATKFYSLEMISKATQVDIVSNKSYTTEQKAAILINEIEMGLTTSRNPSEYLSLFCTIIKDYPALAPIAEKLKGILGITSNAVDSTQNLQELSIASDQSSISPFQQQEKDFLKKLNPSHFQADISYHSEQHHPGTREWLFTQVLQWHEKDTEYRGQPKICLIVGNPGMGKSVIAAKLCTKGEKLRSLAGCFFFQHQKAHRSTPKMLIQTLVYQFSSCMPQYSSMVNDILSYADLASMSVAELFTYLILEPLSQLPANQPKQFVVIDALDECNLDSQAELLKVIVREFVKIPKWISIILTSRPDQKIMQKLKTIRPVIELSPNDPNNVNDIKTFLSDILKEKICPSDFQAGVELLVQKSEGMFLYFHYAVEALISQQSLTLAILKQLLPDGIDDYYDQNFQRLYNILGGSKYQKLLQAVIAARADLPKGLVPLLLQISEIDAAQFISAASVLLPVHNDHIHIFHKSIREWLTDKLLAGEYAVDANAGHEHLANLCYVILEEAKATRDRIEELSSNPVKKYAIENVAYHLINSNQKDLVPRLVATLEDIHFMYYRLRLSNGSTEDIISDCIEAKKVANYPLSQQVEDCLAFIRRYAHILAILPHLVFQCALNEADTFTKRAGVSQFVTDPSKTFPEMKAFFEVTNKSQNTQSAILTYTSRESITSCTMTPDEDLLLCSDFNGKIYFWKKQTAELVHEVETGNHQISTLSVSQDRNLVMYGCMNEAVEICGNKVPMIDKADSDTTACLFSPDRKALLAWSSFVDGIFRLMQEIGMNFKPEFTVELWNLQDSTFKKLLITKRKENRPCSACFSHDGKFVVCGLRDGRIIQWDTSTGESTAILYTDGSVVKKGIEPLVYHDVSPKDDPIYHVTYSPNGHYFAASSNVGILIWDAAALSLLQSLSLNHLKAQEELSQPRYLYCSFSADSQHLVAGTSNGYLQTWNLQSSNQPFKSQIVTRPDGSSNAITYTMFDKQLDIVCALDTSIHVYSHKDLVESASEGTKSKPMTVHPGNATAALFLPDGNRAITCGNKSLFLWHVPTSSELASVQSDVLGYLIQLSHNGELLLTYGEGNIIQVWTTDKLTKIATLCYNQGINISQLNDPDSSSPEDICHCAVSNIGLIAGGTGEGTIYLWYGQGYSSVKVLNGHDSLITFLAFSPCGNYFVSADMEGKIFKWQVFFTAENQLEVNMFSLASHNDSIEQIAFSFGHAQRLVTCSTDKLLHLYSSKTGDLIKRMEGHTTDVMKVAYSSDGSLIVSGDGSGQIIVWDGFTGDLIKRLPVYSNIVLDLCFTCEDKYICSRSVNQGSLYVYEVATGSLVTCLSFYTSICSMSAPLTSSYTICGLKDSSVKFARLHSIES